MLIFFKKIINKISSISKRPNNTVEQTGSSHRIWGKYISFNSINALIFLTDFFIQKLEESGIRPNKRLISITELNILELQAMRYTIMSQIVDCKITLYHKDSFIKFTNQQRQDFHCLFGDYELLLLKKCNNSDKYLLEKISSEFEMISTLRTEINNMFEITSHDV